MSEFKLGAYVCKGCGLGDRLDTDALLSTAKKEGKAVVTKDHDFLCSAAGVKLINDDLASGEVTHVMIAACSRRAKTEAFRFEDAVVTRANLREGVIWVRPDDSEHEETTQEMADDYVIMACTEAKFMQAPQKNPEAASNRELLVVGGGVSGMTAAVEASKAGYKVTIVEKQGQLGGWSGQWFKRVPQKIPYKEPEDNGIAALIKQVEADANITVHLNSRLTNTAGAPGRFQADISTESGDTQQATFGAIVQATGFNRYDINLLPELGGGESDHVVDQIGLEELAQKANGDIIKRADGKEVKSVVFIQCAGQRSDKEGHLSQCSGHCCNTSIKQAMYFKNANPSIDTTILFTDLRTPGAPGEDFYRSGQDKGIIFSKGVAKEVSENGGVVTVKFQDLILDDEVSLEADLVVLATGMVPNSGVNIETVTEEDDQEQLKAQSILNLDYRQGLDIPQLTNGFTDSHFICFPYETRRTGIYTAGPVRRPMDMYQAQEDATGAALKAIQALENASLGRAAHPRSGDLSFPRFSIEGCTQCKRCTVECPFGAIDEDEKRYPKFNEARCRRCGTCMGACPVQVISFENYSVSTVGQQINAIEVPDEMDEKPRILVLACENDAYPALDMAAQNGIHYSAYVRVLPVRCLGSVNTVWIKDTLNNGYDAVALMGCQKGENYQCHFVKGSEMAHYRMSKIDDTLTQLQLETERVQTFEIAITDIERAPQIINDLEELVNKIGLSPFKF